VHDAPIYAQLIRERGDIPLQTRNEARRIQRELDWIVNSGPAPAGDLPRPAAAPAPGPRPLPPGGGSGGNGWFA
jgi:hypothetical protein